MKLFGSERILLFSIVVLALGIFPGLDFSIESSLLAARKEILNDLEKELQFNFYLDQGLLAYINEKNYELAIRNFDAALALKPQDINARKAKRLTLEKSKINPPPATVPLSIPIVEALLVPPKAVHPAVLLSPSRKMPIHENIELAERENLERIKKYYQSGIEAYIRENYSKAAKEMKKILKLDSANAKAKKLLIKIHSLKN